MKIVTQKINFMNLNRFQLPYIHEPRDYEQEALEREERAYERMVEEELESGIKHNQKFNINPLADALKETKLEQ